MASTLNKYVQEVTWYNKTFGKDFFRSTQAEILTNIVAWVTKKDKENKKKKRGEKKMKAKNMHTKLGNLAKVLLLRDRKLDNRINVMKSSLSQSLKSVATKDNRAGKTSKWIKLTWHDVRHIIHCVLERYNGFIPYWELQRIFMIAFTIQSGRRYGEVFFLAPGSWSYRITPKGFGVLTGVYCWKKGVGPVRTAQSVLSTESEGASLCIAYGMATFQCMGVCNDAAAVLQGKEKLEPDRKVFEDDDHLMEKLEWCVDQGRDNSMAKLNKMIENSNQAILGNEDSADDDLGGMPSGSFFNHQTKECTLVQSCVFCGAEGEDGPFANKEVLSKHFQSAPCKREQPKNPASGKAQNERDANLDFMNIFGCDEPGCGKKFFSSTAQKQHVEKHKKKKKQEGGKKRKSVFKDVSNVASDDKKPAAKDTSQAGSAKVHAEIEKMIGEKIELGDEDKELMTDSNFDLEAMMQRMVAAQHGSGIGTGNVEQAEAGNQKAAAGNQKVAASKRKSAPGKRKSTVANKKTKAKSSKKQGDNDSDYELEGFKNSLKRSGDSDTRRASSRPKKSLFSYKELADTDDEGEMQKKRGTAAKGKKKKKKTAKHHSEKVIEKSRKYRAMMYESVEAESDGSSTADEKEMEETPVENNNENAGLTSFATNEMSGDQAGVNTSDDESDDSAWEDRPLSQPEH